MKNVFPLGLALLLTLLFAAPAQAEHHRATHLGNPVTRFAPTMYAPSDLRARFQDEKLHPDFAEVLDQWGWRGDLSDFYAAGLTNEIFEWEIPVGETMPFMSTREDGKPLCLRNVTWAGTEPIHAYAFNFSSKGERYRCVIPKPCSNFFVEDLGPELKPALAIDCDVPVKIVAGRKMQVCLTVHNAGTTVQSNAIATLALPENTTVTATTDGGALTNNSIMWTLPVLTPGSTKQICARLKPELPTTLKLSSTVSSPDGASAQSSCETIVAGIPAILLEKADDPDPVQIGSNTVYTVKVTNQGSADDSNVQVVVTVAPELMPLSSSEGKIEGNVVTLPVVPKLAAKQAVTYTIVAKGMIAGDGHTTFTLSSDVLKSSISAEESTTVY